MPRSARCLRMLALTVCLVWSFLAVSAVAGELILDGDFETSTKGSDLRRDAKGQDWYESRKDTDEGRGLLMLSTKKIGGNRTHKAIIKAHPELNTYLSQRFAEPQTIFLTVSYDIYIKEILADDNRSAFCFVGGVKDKKGGPNSTGKERFVFLGFENAEEAGKVNLFVREGDSDWAGRTVVAANLDLENWYTIVISANIPEGLYEVSVDGVTEPFEVEAFYTNGKTPEELTHISFASWNDGAGTFYIDNVSASDE
ncbi:MAG: hypothetical protein ABIF77_11610 [bacterium]